MPDQRDEKIAQLTQQLAAARREITELRREALRREREFAQALAQGEPPER